MRQPCIAIRVWLLLENLDVVRQVLAAVLVKVYDAVFKPHHLREPDRGHVALAKIPEGFYGLGAVPWHATDTIG
jgi:hypothetical protein